MAVGKKYSRFSTIKPEARQKPFHNMVWNDGDRKAYLITSVNFNYSF